MSLAGSFHPSEITAWMPVPIGAGRDHLQGGREKFTALAAVGIESRGVHHRSKSRSQGRVGEVLEYMVGNVWVRH